MRLTWTGILRLGLVQMALGSIVVLTTATMNRVMVVELALPAILPGLLVSLYYGTQFLRPRFGHGADGGGRRAPWIIGGVMALALGALCAAISVGVMGGSPATGIAMAVPSFLLIGLGIGSAGTNLLALLATRIDEKRQAAAGSAVWIMMILGLAATGIAAGILLDPYSPKRLILVTAGVGVIAILLSLIGVWGQDRHRPSTTNQGTKTAFRAVLAELWADCRIRNFTIFVFASMLAYNLQDLILEPFAGHVFGLTVGQSTRLGGMLHAGALSGMILVLLSGTVLAHWITIPARVWVVGGCVLSGLALIALAMGGMMTGGAWPLTANIFVLGLANGSFAVAAIGEMMRLARDFGGGAREGVRMGVFGAAQAIAFGLGSFLGTAMVDIMRLIANSDAVAYGTVFGLEGATFLIAALLALRVGAPAKSVTAPSPATLIPGE
ncbi:MAG: BCD family MFS transporter [Rhodobacteraceae bacterium]|nr:BCD family MFS transporter [Paracoccaceae bacterium]